MATDLKGDLEAQFVAQWSRRPWWMNLLMLFCLYMTFIYMPFDLFYKPVADDVEVWFGIALHGWAAKATEPLHWLIYAAGAWGFWHMRAWMWPWAAVYCLQIAIGMLVWSWLGAPAGLTGGLIGMAIMLVPTVALWRARTRFGNASAHTVSA